MMTFPVSLGGVIYPDGEIPQNILKGLCDGYITEEESAVAQDAFVKKLAQHGRPSDPACVEVLFGQSLKDLGHLKSAPWSNTLDEPLIWQKSGDDDLYRGWWTVVKSDVLMRMPFDGDCKQGLTALEITRVLAGRTNPHVELLQWVNAWVVEAMEGDDEWEINPIDLMPSEIKALCDLQGTDRKVLVSVQWFWGEGDEPRFSLVEQY
ncbi:MAG: hypothetical protein IPI16_17345 [Comamonadaceae bacterium]|nr:hypothetical protein [Comamonadaceae bacterium]